MIIGLREREAPKCYNVEKRLRYSWEERVVCVCVRVCVSEREREREREREKRALLNKRNVRQLSLSHRDIKENFSPAFHPPSCGDTNVRRRLQICKIGGGQGEKCPSPLGEDFFSATSQFTVVTDSGTDFRALSASSSDLGETLEE